MQEDYDTHWIICRVRLLHATCVTITTQVKWRATASSQENKLSCSKTDPTFISVRKFMAQIWWSDCKLLEHMHKSTAASPGGFHPSPHVLANRPYSWPKIINIQPAFEIFHWHLCYDLEKIGLNGWQCNICAAHDYTHSLLLQLDLSLLSVFRTPDILNMCHLVNSYYIKIVILLHAQSLSCH